MGIRISTSRIVHWLIAISVLVNGLALFYYNILPPTYTEVFQTVPARPLKFEGEHTFIKVKSTSSLEVTGNLTIESIFRMDIVNKNQVLVEKFGCKSNEGGYGLRINEDNRIQFYVVENCNSMTKVTGSTDLKKVLYKEL
jgi:hypothetical protein